MTGEDRPNHDQKATRERLTPAETAHLEARARQAAVRDRASERTREWLEQFSARHGLKP